ncbi:hypothetical protein [Nocardia rhizosphaerihabitans]|uniref:Uncharacterized protein n=1 Tax=Nocardia rhizosphaerihabitans TaxID=1691570 RepID=A0ABQ2KCH8_9NOCA|nr:hypothetical protein [Nocardia rhizosphaerihabitans]GGN77679.1 hypothetical protein GCM10011610_24380 [Nocardia rhizosphaerihabitans]
MTAPIAQELVETYLLNQVSVQTTLATKAAPYLDSAARCSNRSCARAAARRSAGKVEDRSGAAAATT